MDADNITTTDDGEGTDTTINRSFLHARLRLLFLFLLLGYGIMCVLSCALVAYLRVHRRHAFAGDQRAARRVILPAFEPLLVVLAAATFVYTLYFTVALSTNLFASSVSKLATEVFYSGRQFVFLSVVVFMLQPSVSPKALRTSMAVTLVLATYTIPIVALLEQVATTPQQFYLVHTASRALLLLLYFYVVFKPPPRASRQSLREFGLFACVYYALLFAYTARFYQNDPQTGFLLTYANLGWGSLCPLVIWRVLQADTEHWRRLGHRAVALQQNLSSSLSSSTRTASLSSSRRGNVIALECTAANGAHVLVEMQRKFVIDFAYLDLKHAIARGRGRRHSRDYEPRGDTAASRAPVVVYRGMLHGHVHVAVKVYTPPQLDEETIAQFAHEAALCGALRHPNIVHFVGLCVCPPTICMVTELCVGNLETLSRARHRKHSNSNGSQRQQLLVTLLQMLDAARAVAYLHSFSPPFLHRDITPASFLVDADGTVKLTDFGDARSLPTTGQPSVDGSTQSRHNPLMPPPIEMADLLTPSPTSVSMESSQLRTPSPRSQSHVMTIKGTVEYMAPELLRGHAGHACYGEAADVYALAVTMWDLLYPSQPKYALARGNRLKVFETVLAGARPPLGDELPMALRELLTAAWHEEARLRPRADHVVSVLESLQEELTAPFAQRLVVELSAQGLLLRHEGVARGRDVVTGSALVEMLVANGSVDDASEGLRLGNALMDAGILHHASHAKPVEASAQEAYYFDTVKLRALRERARQKDPLGSSYHQRRARAGLSPTRSSVPPLVLLLPPSAVPPHSHRRGEAPAMAARPNSAPLLPRPPSAPLLSRRDRRRDGRTQTPSRSDPLELLCACRRFGQRLQQPSLVEAVDELAARPLPQQPLRKVQSSPLILTANDELPTERMTDWEGFVLAIIDSDNEDEGPEGTAV